MSIEIIFSCLALIIACYSAYVSYRSLKIAEIANTTTQTIAQNSSELTKEMFRRQNIIDLHLAWRGVNDIDIDNLITPDVVLAINALDLTASIWNHDVVKKEIILQSYWRSFSDIYETMYSCTKLLPGKNVTCKQLIQDSPAITTAFERMKDAITSQTAVSSL